MDEAKLDPGYPVSPNEGSQGRTAESGDELNPSGQIDPNEGNQGRTAESGDELNPSGQIEAVARAENDSSVEKSTTESTKKRKGRPKQDSGELDDEEKKQEFYRKRNAMYSRRKYMRKKIEVEVLKQQKNDLINENQTLQAEGGRLTGLLLEAKQLVSTLEAQGSIYLRGSLSSSDKAQSLSALFSANAAAARGFPSSATSRFPPSLAQRFPPQQLDSLLQLGAFREQRSLQQSQNPLLAAVSLHQSASLLNENPLTEKLLAHVGTSNLRILQHQQLPLEGGSLGSEFLARDLISPAQQPAPMLTSQAFVASSSGRPHAEAAVSSNTGGVRLPAGLTAQDISLLLQGGSRDHAAKHLQQRVAQPSPPGGFDLSRLDAASLLLQSRHQPSSAADSSSIYGFLEQLREGSSRAPAPR